MALIDCKFFSETLGLSSSMRVILPEQTAGQIGLAGRSRDSARHPTLYLLHGLSDDETIWSRRTSIERYAATLGLAVVMTNVHRSFYVNMKHGLRYWDFVSEELVTKARSFFPLSMRREDTYVAGLSMGGYGALLLGLRKPEQYAAAASLSGVCDITLATRRGEDFALAFGADAALGGGEYDPFHLASELAASERPKPKFYTCCGSEDFLYEENVRFRDHLSALAFDHHYEHGPGEHEWGYWDRMIQRVLAWLPLPART
jgi:putative tributyrin esterase